MYQFSDIFPQGAVLICDELAALADSYGSQAMRNRTLGATMTSFRKSGGLVLGASAAEWAISGHLKVSSEALITPRRAWPKKTVAVYEKQSPYGNMKLVNKQVYLKTGEMEYPPFCYMGARGLKIPWERKRLEEDYRAELHKARMPARKNGNRQDNLDRWHPIAVSSPTPATAYWASALYDSFARVPVSDQHFIGADRMRAAAVSMPPDAGLAKPDLNAQVEAYLRWSIANDPVRRPLRKRLHRLRAS